MDITIERAIQIANQHLSEMSENSVINLVITKVIEESFGWVFIYNSEKYLKTGQDADLIVGNAPFVVNKNDGSIYNQFGTARSVQFYIEEYKKNFSI